MQNKKSLIIGIVAVVVLGVYVLNGATFKNLWNNLTASLGGYGAIANPGDKVISGDSTTITYYKELHDTTGAVYDRVKMEKTVPKGQEEQLLTVNGVLYTKAEFSALPKSGKTVDQSNPADNADADGVVLHLAKNPATASKSDIAAEHASVKSQIEHALGKTLTTAKGKNAGKVNYAEFTSGINTIELRGVAVKDTQKKLKELTNVTSIEPNTIPGSGVKFVKNTDFPDMHGHQGGTATKHTVNVKDMPQVAHTLKKGEPTGDMQGEEEEKQEFRDTLPPSKYLFRPTKQTSTTPSVGTTSTPSTSVATSISTSTSTPTSPSTSTIPTPGVGFAGPGQIGWLPPDTQGAAGPNHLVAAVNSEIVMYNKTGTILSDVGIATFFAPILPTGTPISDPIVSYDESSGRFYFTELSIAPYNIMLAVSQTNDPTGAWDEYAIPADPTGYSWCDYEKMGINQNWLTITCDMFRVNATFGGFLGTNIYVVNKASVLSGSPFTPTVFSDPTISVLGPAVEFGTNPNEYMVTRFGDATIGLYRVCGESACGGSPSTPIYGFMGTLAAMPSSNTIPRAPQPGGTTLDSGFGNFMPIFRNGNLWVSDTVGMPAAAPTRASAYWGEVTNLSATPTIVQEGVIDDPTGGMFYYYPTIAVDSYDNVGMGFTGSSLGTYASTYYASRAVTDTLGTMSTPLLGKAGVATADVRRWGDYSATVVDPSDDSFWTIQEYAPGGGGLGPWGTWWSNFSNHSITTSAFATITNLPLYFIDPVTTTTTAFPKTLAIKNKSTQTLTFTPTISGNPNGMTVSFSPAQIISLAPGATANLLVTTTVNHNILPSGQVANATVSLATLPNVGTMTIPVNVSISGRLLTDHSRIDYGLDLAGQANWSGSQQVALTNTLTDASMTYTVTTDCCTQDGVATSGFTLGATPASITIPAGGTVNVNTTLSAVNTTQPNGRYNGTLTLTSTSGMQTLHIPITFWKGYGIRLNYGTAGAPYDAMLYPATPTPILTGSNNNTEVHPAPTDTSTIIYTNVAGPWSVFGIWDPTDTLGTYVGKENITLGSTILDVPLSKTEAAYTVSYEPSAPNGTLIPSTGWDGTFMIQPRDSYAFNWSWISFTHPYSFKTNTISNIVYSMSVNASYLTVPLVFQYQSSNVSQDIHLTNTPADFKIKHLVGFPNTNSSNVQFSVTSHVDTNGATAPWRIQAPVGSPVDLYAYSNNGVAMSDSTYLSHIPTFTIDLFDQSGTKLQTSDSYYVTQNQTYHFLDPFNWETNFTYNTQTYQYFKMDAAPSDMINIGIGPLVPATNTWAYRNLQVYDRVWDRPAYHYGGGSYDYTGTPYAITNSGGTVASGTFGLGFWITFSPVTSDTYGLRLTKNPQINTTPTTVTTTSTFSLPGQSVSNPTTDERSPNITEIHIIGNGLWQNLIDPSISNTISFKVDPVPGIQTATTLGAPVTYLPDSISHVSMGYRINSTAPWTNIPVTLSGGSYSATLPIVSGTTLYTYEIDVTDAAGNTISHQFQVPTGTAMQPPSGSMFPAPVISSVTAVPAYPGSIKASWTTDQPSDSQVVYDTVSHATSGAYASIFPATADPALVTAHSVLIPGLIPSRTYYYRVMSKNAVGSLATSTPEQSFTTPPPDTIAPTAVSLSANSGTVSGWVNLHAYNVTDNIGVDHVTFYANTTAVYTATAESPAGSGEYPGQWDTTTAANGNYILTAKACDLAGNCTTSNSIAVTVQNVVSGDTTPPSISSIATSNITTSAGTISWTTNELADTQVIYGTSSGSYPNTSFLNTSLALTHSVTLTPLSSSRTYYFKVESRDAAGNLAVSTPESSFTTLSQDLTPPTVSITAPTAGSTLSGTTAISVNASDNVGVDHVDFYKGTTIIGADASAPYSVNWDTTTVVNGSYTLTAKAYDAAGNFTTSSAVTVTINNVIVPPPDTTPPTVTLTAPASGQTLSGVTTLTANASDNVGVTKVEFYRGTTLIDLDTTGSPYAITWNTTTVANGTYSITAKAYDAAGNFSTTSVVSVSVYNDSIIPIISITAPTNGATVSGTTTFSANATDNIAVTKVEFYQGATLLATDTTSPYSYSWNTTVVSNGAVTLTAKAYDAVNNIGTASLSVSVNNVTCTTPPAVSMTTPSNGATVSGTAVLSASATTCTSGISKVEFYQGATLLATDTTSPYSYSWNTIAVPNGSYTLMAKGYDVLGGVGTSSTITVIVNNPVSGDTTPPVVTITAPTSATLPNNGNVNVTATATDASSIAGMSVSIDGVVKKTCAQPATTCTYKWQMNGATSGTHTITALAYDGSTNHNLGTATPKVVTK